MLATKVVLPLFKARGKPFVLVYWSRDPDGTQHNQGDSLGAAGSRHQRTDLARGDPQRRRKPGADCSGRCSISASPNDDRHHHRGRSRLLDDLEGERHQPRRQGELCRRADGAAAATALSRSISAQVLGMPLLGPGRARTRRSSRQAPIARQRTDRRGSEQCPDIVVAGERRLGPDLSAEARHGGRKRRRAVVALRCLGRITSAGCLSMTSSGRSPGTLPLERHRPARPGGDAAPGDRRQFPLVRYRLRRARALHRRDRRYRPAAGPGHARLVQPRRHREFHGGRQAPISKPALSIRRRSATPISARRSRISCG